MSFGVAEYPSDGRTIDELLGASAVATRRREIGGKENMPVGSSDESRVVTHPRFRRSAGGSSSSTA